MSDLTLVLANFGLEAGYSLGDVNDDGVVDLRDLNKVRAVRRVATEPRWIRRLRK